MSVNVGIEWSVVNLSLKGFYVDALNQADIERLAEYAGEKM